MNATTDIDGTYRRWFTPQVVSLLVGLLLVASVFPDVFFLGATTNVTGMQIAAQRGMKPIVLYGEPHHRQWSDQYYDYGGSLFQSEPMQQFTRSALMTGESPYWNPYSGAGQMGPETLVDLKFSPQSILLTPFGGSQLAFDVVVMGSYVLATACLYFVLTQYMALPALAAVGSCLVYMLNGYNVANLCSNTTQSYLYFPVLLLAICAFGTRPNVMRFIALVAANTLILATTFLPTSLLIMLSVYAIGIAYTVGLTWRNQEKLGKRFLFVTACQLFAGPVALGILGFLYLPILASMQVADPVAMYNARQFYPVNINSLLSFFSSRHFWEEYNARSPLLTTGLPNNPSFKITNAMFHYGIVASLAVAAGVFRKRSWNTPIMWSCLILLTASLGRIFDAPIIGTLIGSTFGVRSLGEQYWFAALTVAFVIACGFGFDAITQRTKWIWAGTGIVYATVAAAIVYVYLNCGFILGHKGATQVSVAFLVGVLLVSAVLLRLTQASNAKWAKTACILLVGLCAIELTRDMIHYRFERTEFFSKPPEAVNFLQEHCDSYRVANLGEGALPAERGAAFRIQQIESLNMEVFPAYQKFFERNFLATPKYRWGIFPTMILLQDNQPLNLQMLDVLGVKYVGVTSCFKGYCQRLEQDNYKEVFRSKDAVIFENPHVYPRLFAVSCLIDADSTPDTQVTSPRLMAFSTDKKLLSAASSLGVNLKPAFNAPSEPDSAAKILEYQNTYIKAQAHLTKPSVLVLMDNWHPDWHARVNGQESYIGKINESFRGIALPAGDFTIEMRYLPPSVPVGQLLTAATATLLLLLLIFRKRIDMLVTQLLQLQVSDRASDTTGGIQRQLTQV